MSTFPTSKELLKLAKACRKAGIKHFKCAEYEIVLTDEEPPKTAYKKRKEASKSYEEVAKEFESDSLTDEQLLMWSAGMPDGEMELKSDEGNTN